MKSCIKKFVSVSLIILLALGTMLPAAGGAEVVVCSDCFEHMEAGEEHTYESAEPFIEEAATVPEDEGRSVIAPAEEHTHLSNEAGEEAELPIVARTATAASEQARAYYAVAGKPVLDRIGSRQNGLYTKDGGIITAGRVDGAFVGEQVAFYWQGTTICRKYLITGEVDAVAGLQHIVSFSVESVGRVRWYIPGRPEQYGLSYAQVFELNESDPFPFVCYEYNFETGVVSHISRAQIFEEFWASETQSSEYQSNNVQPTSLQPYEVTGPYPVRGVTLPLAEYPVASYYSKDHGPCNCHGIQNACGDRYSPVCNCEYYRYGDKYQCNGFAQLVFDKLLRHAGREEGSPSADVKLYHLSGFDAEVNTADEWKRLFALIPVGSKILFLTSSSTRHYIVLISKDDTGILLYDCNGTGACRVSMRRKSYAEMAGSWRFDNSCYYETVEESHDHYYIPDSSGGTHSCAYNACDQKNLAHALGTEVSDENAEKHSKTCTVCRGKVMFDHSFTQYTNITNTHHAVKCSACQRVGSAAAHQNVGYTPLQSGHRVACAVCGTTTLPHSFEVAYNAASHYALCSYCGYANTAVFEDHSFAYVDVDDTVHRRYCTGCGYGGNSSHAFSAWISSGSSSHKRTCSLCGREVTQAHVFGAWSNFSASQHRSQCSACSHYRYGNHGYGSWGQYSSSRHQRSCVSCGRYDYASHTFGSWSSLSATQHRRTCNACGYNNDASHSFSYEQIPNNRAAHRVNCSTCGYSAVQPHSPDANGYCIRCGSYTGIHLTGVGENEQ